MLKKFATFVQREVNLGTLALSLFLALLEVLLGSFLRPATFVLILSLLNSRELQTHPWSFLCLPWQAQQTSQIVRVGHLVWKQRESRWGCATLDAARTSTYIDQITCQIIICDDLGGENSIYYQQMRLLIHCLSHPLQDILAKVVWIVVQYLAEVVYVST